MKYLITIVLLSCILGAMAQRKIDFEKLDSPIIFRGDYKFAYRDPAVVFHNGVFHLYFTVVERATDEGYFLYTGYSRSNDLMHWSFPKIITPRDRTLNYSSPGNVVRYDDQWIICLQTYPQPNMEVWGNNDSRIWIMRSNDLENWSEPELLKVKGNNIAIEEMGRMIDPYLLEDQDVAGKWWCYYKQKGVSMSYSYNLKDWIYCGNSHAGENVTVLSKNGEYVMFHSPENGIGVKRSKSPIQWGADEQLITLGQVDWPWAQRRLTAATVIDLTGNKNIGKYIMFFHGGKHDDRVPVRNCHHNASLAIAWSDDLINWEWPGK
ncbi:hypothetical protein EYV94_26675 [Puteibacter caeruleilacunae]|nr:hypothetical protein EYV94_26675 [Puteibacter caeruleilacunae]